MINFPKLISGATPFAAWLNRLQAASKQCNPISIEGFKIEQGTDGWRAHKNFQTSGGTPSPPAPSNYKLVAIKSLGSTATPPNPNLLICSSATGDGVISHDTIYVAKARNMRRIAKEFFADNGANITQNYTYFAGTAADSSYGDNFRTATDGLQTELEAATPRYVTFDTLVNNALGPEQCLIHIIDVSSATGVVDPNGNPVTKLEVIPARTWAKVVNA
jgi:hypothetical protein